MTHKTALLFYINAFYALKKEVCLVGRASFVIDIGSINFCLL